MQRCKAFFPFTITHILTDNGLEFTNALLVSKKGEQCFKPSKMDEFCKTENVGTQNLVSLLYIYLFKKLFGIGIICPDSDIILVENCCRQI